MGDNFTIKKILVANRGEIAIRVFRAATELKIATVAIFTHEDRYSLHRFKADQSFQIGDESEPLKPYLDIEAIIKVAKDNQVDAIHPGYGFLSENVDFVRRCEEEGIIFIGPKAEAMMQLGDKVAAKKVAKEIGVPVITDSKKDLNTEEDVLSEAEIIGYPVMLKAAAGGGGRGMRVVRNAEDMRTAFNNAKGEALKAFGDDTVFLEKFIDNPKHVEVQILGDNFGNIVHLYERDCSVQRRFQKVIEIAPSVLRPDTKYKLFDYAVKIAKYVNYSNAGTVEFLVDKDENIFFIEVNPRIQVEHTITEEITGIDIVRSQIIIASGYPLTHRQIFIHRQEDIQCNGWAIQCRITTEDTELDFKPDYGTIIAYRNAGGYGIRLDEGNCYTGVTVSPFFDSMLVKVSSSGRTLKGASDRLRRTLEEFRIRGVKTNMPFLINVLSNEVFREGRATVNFIQENPQLMIPDPEYFNDRGTKMLKYLAELKVNGHPDVKRFDSEKVFRTPIVPEVSRNDFPKGTKDLLTEMGREAFMEYIKNEKKIFYTDTTLRDAHQSLFATRLRNYDILKITEGIAKDLPEIFSLEVWGGATFDVTMRFLHEDPWERLRMIRKSVPNILLQMLFRGSNAVGYAAYPDNVLEQFIIKSAENGIDIFRIFDSLNWVEGMAHSIEIVREKTNAIAEACICYTGDILNPDRQKFNLQYYVDLAKQLEAAGAHMLAIKDMAGLLKPYAAEVLIKELKKHISIPIHLHTHDTSSVQSTTYIKAIEAGVDVVDCALASMSGLTSQPNFNSLVAVMHGAERENPISLKKLNEYSNYFEAVREYYYPFESELKAGTAEVYDHEIPGGQYSNLLPQARSLGLEDKFETIKQNYVVVNELFGDIVKVTPSSKVVGDMALFMTSNNLTAADVLERGDTLAFPESVKQLFRGDLGQPYGGFPKALQSIILKKEIPYTERPNAHIKPIDFDLELQLFHQKFDDKLTTEDLLSYIMFPKVFEDFYKFRKYFGKVEKLPTPYFYYPLKTNEELIVNLDLGKNMLINFRYMSEPNEDGIREVYFRINGQTRNIVIKDNSVKSTKPTNEKVSGSDDIGSPLQGRLIKILVDENQEVEKDHPLFVIEAMKMETTICAPKKGKVAKIILKQNAMIEQDDCVMKIQ
ncbi:pyruvate carboxylase [Flavobacterium enshiense DK69]|uniref:Pyruvate carboxylase n=1 Tax=Flavobacterium enshiense DK69 TaxID=1107311 RepID=V6SC34_9FLAO|nr:pyruvate carboxylase [Flavobacterium enshiense]ESU24156.1 pyruvate carboxylase [Flavobacterium enshiense DK69]KGO95466.1 pyruvate carboxylase [Flavobacterium enshiense DK69]